MDQLISYPGRAAILDPIQEGEKPAQKATASIQDMNDVFAASGMLGFGGGGVEQNADGTAVSQDVQPATPATSSGTSQPQPQAAPTKPVLPPQSIDDIQMSLMNIVPMCTANVIELTRHLFDRHPDQKMQVRIVAEYTHAAILGWAKKMRCDDFLNAALKLMITTIVHELLLKEYYASKDEVGIAAVNEYYEEQKVFYPE